VAYDAPHNDRQRVLDATEIVDIVGEHIAIKAKGREFVCLCPFHDDHKPSMFVVPQKQIYHCFSCGAGGNAIDFVINYHKMDFRDALTFLADRAGIELTPWRKPETSAGESGAEEVSRESVVNANRFACDFFRTIFGHPEHGHAARDAAARRNFTDETIESFAIGASPDRWDGLIQTAKARSVELRELRAAGLLKDRPTGDGQYDTFRNRLIFPIHDQLGRVIAFGGRRLKEEDDPKYLNSPESVVFDKSSTLYGLHQASQSIRDTDVAIVVEGYTDVIGCHQAGFRNVVASLGTALTARHSRILRRLCSQVVLIFDADEAGARAADRALEVFFSQPIDVRIVVLPGGKDPADLLDEEGGAEAFRNAIENGVDALEYRFARMRERFAGVNETTRVQLVEEDLKHLNDLGLSKLSPIRRRVIFRRLASLIGVDEETIARAAPQMRPRTRGADQTPSTSHTDRVFSPADHVLGCLLVEPTLRETDPDLVGSIAVESFTDSTSRNLAEYVLSNDSNLLRDLKSAMHDLETAEARSLAAAVASHVQQVTDRDADRLRLHFEACLRTAARTMLALDNDDRRAKHPSRIDEQLAALRERQTRFGGDPLALPRPQAAKPPG
jgi:DNA primase